jgi:hypothetical protein
MCRQKKPAIGCYNHIEENHSSKFYIKKTSAISIRRLTSLDKLSFTIWSKTSFRKSKIYESMCFEKELFIIKNGNHYQSILKANQKPLVRNQCY